MSIMICEPTIDHNLLHRLNRQSCDRNWIRENYEQIHEKYQGNYVAVLENKVCYNSESIIELVAEIIVNGQKTDNYVIEHLPD